MTLLSEGPKFVKELVEETGLKRPTVQLILSDLAASKQVYSKEAEGAKLWYVLEAGGNTHA
jgi:DNA-binding IclR family transcriptional regulator